MGEAVNLNDLRAKEIKEYINNQKITTNNLIEKWELKKSSLRDSQVYDFNKINTQIENINIKLLNRVEKSEKAIKETNSRKGRFKFAPIIS